MRIFPINEFLRTHLPAPKELMKFKCLPLEEQNPRVISPFIQGTQGRPVRASVLPVDPKMMSNILFSLKQPGGKAPKRV